MQALTRHQPMSLGRWNGRWSASALTCALLACLFGFTLAACAPPSRTQRPVTAAGQNAPGMTLVVMGASDAYGVGTDDFDRQNWPTQLAEDLPQPVHLVNLGIPGATMAQARQEELPVAAAQHPRILVLWLAVNDIIERVPLAAYSADLRAILATLKAESPGTHVFVGNVPDLAQLPFFYSYDPVALQAQVAAWNAAISQDCAAEGATLADLASGWGQLANHPEYVSPDGLHPSPLGALELAAYFDIVIRQTLHLNG
ncbi:MAG TPA: SGNH/GDSL hydrolase family protein [Ktedonobacterales bacterium]|nr:SGNH/GDSL hydrolase family protein [Ktedonobacterales bacterium]